MLAMRDFPVPVHKLSVNELPLRAETAGGKGLEGLMSACFSTASRKIGSEQESAGAVEKTRTSTGCPTATSTLRVYQFRHDRIVVGVVLRRRGCM